jgi:hypothetical protein
MSSGFWFIIGPFLLGVIVGALVGFLLHIRRDRHW